MSLLRRRVFTEGLSQTPVSGASIRLVPRPDQPRVVWRFSDGKPGHDNQSLGLVDALERRLAIEVYDVPVFKQAGIWRDLLTRRFCAGTLLSDPWLMVGAGHATHLPMLTARRARGGKVVVIMSPDLPKSLFDLCLIPDHDSPSVQPNVLVTRGSLNRMRRLALTESRQGLIMIGGPSKHYQWDHQAVANQISRIIRFSPNRHWTLTTSRRTPPGFVGHVREQVFNGNMHFHVASWSETSAQWIAGRLAHASSVWVTEDSVSMVYEALTAGCAVGLLAVPPRGRGRVVNGMQRLQASQQVTPFSDWCAGKPLTRPDEVFDEANRSAQWVCEQWGI